MTLHEAIEKLLRQTNQAMAPSEIAYELNKNKWYVKKDKTEIKTNQITARVADLPNIFEINRSISPMQIRIWGNQLMQVSKEIYKISKMNTTKKNEKKTSFDPISNSDTTILILGTLPGDKSLELGEYYGHARNKFWKIISNITNNELPINYTDKKLLLLKTKIGVWDIVHKANRKGSLDKAIENEVPNDIGNFITNHKNLSVIGLNGIKAAKLYDKYFRRRTDITYLVLPSSSPANASIRFEDICKTWKQILYK